MFKAEIKSDVLKGIVYIVSTLVDEVKFSISSDSVSLRAIDPAHVAMIEADVSSKAFESYSAEETEIGLDLEKVKSVLKLAGPSDVISMEHDPDQGRLTFRIGNITRSMSLVDTGSMSDPKVPNIDLRANVKVKVDQLQKGVRASESISDHISLEADSDGFELACRGDTDSAVLRIPTEDLESITADEKARSLYPLDYFSNMLKVIPSSTVIDIQLDTDYPVKLLFGLAEGEAKFVYFLAPRIESD